jgi:hypothetical protein
VSGRSRGATYLRDEPFRELLLLRLRLRLERRGELWADEESEPLRGRVGEWIELDLAAGNGTEQSREICPCFPHLKHSPFLLRISLSLEPAGA